MRRAFVVLLAVLALPAPASAEWSCADATYASEVCPWVREAPWFGEAADGYAVPGVAMRWSSDGYPPGSAAMNWNDGIYVIVTLPAAGPRDAAALLVDIAYEPHGWQGEARALMPEAVIVRLGEKDWRADAPEYPPPASDRFHWPPRYVGGNLYRFTFGADLVAAMLAASTVALHSYRDIFLSDDPSAVLRFEILFRDDDGGIFSSDDILEIDSGICEVNCRPHLSLAGFAEAYAGSAADSGSEAGAPVPKRPGQP
ncbi:hypothetical protein [Natronohydrobacter thiooxidans]|uniref:hypothetical protein n=1 Tax=Natronohydrobacter thiooxidans TaxID=87172 RepID=UPI0008FF51E9|nr:hypothetical protein [Natronohydrobacter thiooxidans]